MIFFRGKCGEASTSNGDGNTLKYLIAKLKLKHGKKTGNCRQKNHLLTSGCSLIIFARITQFLTCSPPSTLTLSPCPPTSIATCKIHNSSLRKYRTTSALYCGCRKTSAKTLYHPCTSSLFCFCKTHSPVGHAFGEKVRLTYIKAVFPPSVVKCQKVAALHVKAYNRRVLFHDSVERDTV